MRTLRAVQRVALIDVNPASVDWHPLGEFLEPIQHNVDLPSTLVGGLLRPVLDEQEALPVKRDVVAPTAPLESEAYIRVRPLDGVRATCEARLQHSIDGQARVARQSTERVPVSATPSITSSLTRPV